MDQMASKLVELSKILGADEEQTLPESKQAAKDAESLAQAKESKHDAVLLEVDPKSLRARVRKLELHYPRLHQKASALEEEFFGKSNEAPRVQQPKVSLRSKIE